MTKKPLRNAPPRERDHSSDGGGSSIPGIRTIGSQVLGLPVRIAQPENLVGMIDKLYSPAYSTSVGLLNWSMLMTEIGGESSQPKISSRGGGFDWEYIKSLVRRLFP